VLVSNPPGEVLELRRASFGYAGAPVVQDLTLSVGSGEVVALLGPNGSGKSTVVRGVLGLADHLGGEVRLLGTPLEDFEDRHRVGYVPQRHTLTGSVRSTVREVVATGLLAQRPWWRRMTAADRHTVQHALHLVNLADRGDADVATLSGGQQRRVLIARALVAGPEVLLMDEPTAGVDAANQRVLAEVLRRLAETGVTMVVVTHELAALRGTVRRIVELEAGRLCYDGTPEGYAVHQAEVVRASSATGRAREHSQPGGGHHHEPEPTHAEAPLLGAGPLDPRPPHGNGVA
jgi:zinc transport system ATP-binding protein